MTPIPSGAPGQPLGNDHLNAHQQLAAFVNGFTPTPGPTGPKGDPGAKGDPGPPGPSGQWADGAPFTAARLTQAQFDQITPDPDVVYFIVG